MKPMNYPVPRLVPMPEQCCAADEPVMSLNGAWAVRDLESTYASIAEIPQDMAQEHLRGLSDHYEYRRSIVLPASSEGERLVLKFEGVNAFAKVFVNSHPVAAHQNGFLSWTAEITDYVERKSGEEAVVNLCVEVDEGKDKVSCFSRGGILRCVWLYRLPAAYVNAEYLTPLFDEDMTSCTLRVDLDIEGERTSDGNGPVRYEAEFTLTGPDGEPAAMVRAPLENRIRGYYTTQIPVRNPRLWDAEHPNLYTLRTVLFGNGTPMETIVRRTGLRRIQRRGNRVYVNDREIKLRGVCRHEISPKNGRALTGELIEKDVALFKEANCNYIRTSHYPPSEYFLDQCDENGIYVEDETALAFVAKSSPYSQRDPEETERFLSHYAEILARDYNHPSVIIWSLGNESFGGYNYDLGNRYLHRMDPTRLTKFSYPMTLQEEHEMPDVWSVHYSEYSAPLGEKRDNLSVGGAPGRDLPVIHDEFAHVPCYNREEMRRDPAVHSYWGRSLQLFWDKIYRTEGALGGAIWAGIDDTDIYSGGNGRMEWGLLDVWRRKKPEFYYTRKAYSPVRLIHSEFSIEEKRLVLILQNRFFHTDFSEVTVCWKRGSKAGRFALDGAVPGEVLKMVVTGTRNPEIFDEGPETEPVQGSLFAASRVLCGDAGASSEGLDRRAKEDELYLAFADASGRQIDEMIVRAREAKDADFLPERISERYCKNTGSVPEEGPCQAPKEERRGSTVRVMAGRFVFSFDAQKAEMTGLDAVSEDGMRRVPLVLGGPQLNIPEMKGTPWKGEKLEVNRDADSVRVIMTGRAGTAAEMEWTIRIWGTGLFRTDYRILHMNEYLPKQIKMRVGVDAGGLDELGVTYVLAPSFDSLEWTRAWESDDPCWVSTYPEDHISRIHGRALRSIAQAPFGEEPSGPWGEDIRRDILNGRYDPSYRGSNDFTSTKEHLAAALLSGGDGMPALAVLGNAGRNVADALSLPDESRRGLSTVNVRLEVPDPEEEKIPDDSGRISRHGTWYTVRDTKGSDHGTEMWSHEKGAFAECTFTGTGVVWYGPQDPVFGYADVFLDGVKAADHINQRTAGSDFSCTMPGYDKRYHVPIFSAENLPYGEHTIRIEVCGEHAPDAHDSYVVIDYLRILGVGRTEPLALHVNQEFAFPHISWGNVRKEPIVIGEGSTGSVLMLPL